MNRKLFEKAQRDVQRAKSTDLEDSFGVDMGSDSGGVDLSSDAGLDWGRGRRQAALQADVAALCRSRNTAQRTLDRYEQFLASCRAMLGFRPSGCTGEHEKAAGAQVRDAIIQVNEDENVFLREWGGEAFITVVCR